MPAAQDLHRSQGCSPHRSKRAAEQGSSPQHGVLADASARSFGDRPAPASLPTPCMPALWQPQQQMTHSQEGPELCLVPSSELAGGAPAELPTAQGHVPLRLYQEPLSTRPLSSTAESILASPGQDLYDLLAGDKQRAQQGGRGGQDMLLSQEEQASMFGSDAFSSPDSEPLTHKEDPYASSGLPSLCSPHIQRAYSNDHLAAFCAEHYK